MSLSKTRCPSQKGIKQDKFAQVEAINDLPCQHSSTVEQWAIFTPCCLFFCFLFVVCFHAVYFTVQI